MITDRFDQPLSVAAEAAAEAYVEALDLSFASEPGAAGRIDAALAADPDFALAYCVQSRTLLLEGRTEDARVAVQRARALAGSATPREQAHVEIVARATEGDSAGALALLEAHADRHPRDALPLSLALGVYGLLGFGGFVDFPQRQVALLERVAPHWGEDWWFDTFLGWAYVEIGECARGIPLLDRALAARPTNANAAHARAHGYYETGAAAEGDAFIADWLPCYDRSSVLHCHLCWHRALFALQLGEPDRAMEIYRDGIRPSVSLTLPMFTMIDCAAFAWRAALQGHPLLPEELRELAAFTDERFRKAGVPFANVHAAVALAAAGELSALPELIEEVDSAVAAGRQPCGDVGLRLCRAFQAYASGDYGTAGDALSAVASETVRLGGSHAQRDLFLDTLIAARLRSGAPAQALEALRSRLGKRTPHLDEAWMDRLEPSH